MNMFTIGIRAADTLRGMGPLGRIPLGKRTILVAAVLGVSVFSVPTSAVAQRLVWPLSGGRPLADAAAAHRVLRSSFEPRPDNYAANHRVPSPSELAYFHSHSDMPLARYVTGQFRGTTDEILQWGARKWGFSPDLFRAVAVVETWWHMSFVGNDGTAFGLMQVRVPYHCCLPEIQNSTAFNVDYYGANLRSTYSGLYPWLNQVPHGRAYGPGDLWGSVGEWASGRWYLGDSQWYAGWVQRRLREHTWHTDRWF
jgi:autotransporter family porin